MQDRAAARVQEAWFYYERRRHADALAACHAALAERPDDEHALYLGGFCCLHLEDRDGAREMAGSLLAAHPASPGGHELLGLLAGDAGEFLQAEKHLREALRLDAGEPGRYAMLGALLGRAGRVEEGITAAHKGLALDPECHAALRALQALYRLNDEPELAEEMGQRALRADPEDAQSHLEYGLAALEQRQTREARGRFLDSLRIDPVSGDSMEVIAHERVRTHPFFRHGPMLPIERGPVVAALLTPVFWWALSLLFRPLILVCWASVAVLALGYAYRGAFHLCRRIVLRRLREGRV